MKPNLIIFRLPDEDGDMQFVELAYEDGKLATKGAQFSVLPEDKNYRSMRFDHIVIASRIPGGSHDLSRYAIDDDVEHRPAVINEMGYDQLSTIVDHLIKEHLSLH